MEEKIARVNLKLTDAQHQQLKAIAFFTERTMQQVLEDAIEREHEELKEESVIPG